MHFWVGLMVVFLIGGFAFLLFILRVMFGTYSVSEAYHIFKTLRELEKKYSSMFDQRDNLLYHIGWAKSRGDMLEAKQMMKNLDAMDDDLDELEREINMWKGRGVYSKKHEC